MQADDGPEAEAGGDGGGEEGTLVPTVFPPRRPKTYKLKKGQVCACVWQKRQVLPCGLVEGLPS